MLLPALLGGAWFRRQNRRAMHALSLVGAPQMAPDFKHFRLGQSGSAQGRRRAYRAIGTFDSLNRYAVKGNPAVGLTLIHATLMTSSLDEPSTDYGLVAAWVSHPADFSSATFGLRPEATFHDGRPITPEDVVFTLEAIKKANPRYALYYKNVVRAEKTGQAEVTFYFDAPGNRELPQIVGGLPVLARHFWTGSRAARSRTRHA